MSKNLPRFVPQLASLVSRYTLEVRISKDPFVLNTFFGIVQEAAADVRSESKDMLGVEVILHTLKQRLTPTLSAALEPENVIKGRTTRLERQSVSAVADYNNS